MLAIQHIHPILVHFPIVLMITVLVIDVCAALAGRSVTTRSALGTVSTFVALACGGFAIAAWVFGGIALDFAEAGGFSSDIAETHEGLGEFTAFAFLIWGVIRLALWLRNRELGRATIIVPAVELAGAVLVSATAYYGGLLVYELGVNVTKAAVGG
jgi:uncharacterized membrane protein